MVMCISNRQKTGSTHDGNIGGGRAPPGRPPGSGGAPPPGRLGIAGAGRPVAGGNGGFRPPKELWKPYK